LYVNRTWKKTLFVNTERKKNVSFCLVLHIEKQKGTLSFGGDADFILLDDQLNVLSTFIAGEQAWTVNDNWSINNLRIKSSQ
jgi:hypothetical protein